MLNYAIDKAPTKAEWNKNYAADESEILDVLCESFGFTLKDDELIIETANSLFHKVDIFKMDKQNLLDSKFINVTNMVLKIED